MLINRALELVDDYTGTDPRPHRGHGEFDRGRHACVVTGELVRPMPNPLMWAVLLGDAVHNLRSALGHLIWQLVLLNTARDGATDNQFPICDTGSGYWSIGKKGEPSMLERRLRGIAKSTKR